MAVSDAIHVVVPDALRVAAPDFVPVAVPGSLPLVVPDDDLPVMFLMTSVVIYAAAVPLSATVPCILLLSAALSRLPCTPPWTRPCRDPARPLILCRRRLVYDGAATLPPRRESVTCSNTVRTCLSVLYNFRDAFL